MEHNKSNDLIIIAGAAGEIGLAYCKEIITRGKSVIAVVRNKKTNIVAENFMELSCDLSNQREVEEVFSDIDFASYSRIIFIHSIGVDKYNSRGYPTIQKMNTIDPAVYEQVNSFKYLFRFLNKKVRDINKNRKLPLYFKTVMIGGTSDKYTPFVIEDFCESKFIIRQYISNAVNMNFWASGLSVNVTSTITSSALAVRPFADTTFWLKPDDVVKESIYYIFAKGIGYEEVDLFKFNPNYHDGYYENDKEIFEKWEQETKSRDTIIIN